MPPTRASFARSKPIVRGKLLLIPANTLGKLSIEKKIPEKKIDVRPVKRVIIFPTLKSIMKDAAISPIPMKGIAL